MLMAGYAFDSAIRVLTSASLPKATYVRLTTVITL